MRTSQAYSGGPINRTEHQWLAYLVGFAIIVQDSLRTIPGLGQAQAAITVIIAVAVIGVSISNSIAGQMPSSQNKPSFHLVLFGAFLAWSILKLALEPRLSGFQNVLVWALIPFCIALGVRSSSTQMSSKLVSVTKRAITVASVLYLGSIIAQTLGFLTTPIYSSRSAGWVFALALAFLAPTLVLERCIRFSALPFLCVVITLSRTAGLVALLAISIMLVLKYTKSQLDNPKKLAKSIVLSVAALSSISWFVFSYSDAVQSRFIGGDNFYLGDLQFNTSGRGTIWALVINNAQQHSLLGSSPGNSQDLVTAFFAGQVEHPHNEYLRIWNDLGIVGLTLWLLAWGATLVFLAKGTVSATNSKDRALGLGGTLVVLGFLGGCLTDNVSIYYFLIIPVSVIVGVLSRPQVVDSHVSTMTRSVLR
jgi:O-antigen ligase